MNEKTLEIRIYLSYHYPRQSVPTLGTSREVLASAWAMIYCAELPHKCSTLIKGIVDYKLAIFGNFNSY